MHQKEYAEIKYFSQEEYEIIQERRKVLQELFNNSNLRINVEYKPKESYTLREDEGVCFGIHDIVAKWL